MRVRLVYAAFREKKVCVYYSQLRQGSRYERRYAISALHASTSSAFSFAESSGLPAFVLT